MASEAAKIAGVSKVLTIDDSALENKIAENHAGALQSVLGQGFTHIISASSNYGKNFLFRVAALAGASPLSDAIKVIDAETFQRPMYAGNAIATVKMTDAVKFITIRATAFEKTVVGGSAVAKVESVAWAGPAQPNTPVPTFVSVNETKSGIILQVQHWHKFWL